MTVLRITVGAAMDRSFETTLNTLLAATQRAQRRIGAEQQKGSRQAKSEAERAADAATKAADKAADKAAKAAKRAADAKDKAAKKATETAQKEADKAAAAAEKAADRAIAASNRQKLAQIRNIRAFSEEGVRAMQLQARNLEAQDRLARAQARKRPPVAGAIGKIVGGAVGAASAAYGAYAPVVGAAVAGGAMFARAAGADLSVESIAGKNADLQSQAQDLANAAYMPGDKGLNGIRRSPQELIDKVRATALATGSNQGEVMEGLSAFVAKTGDLQTGIESMTKLAALAKATGASVRDTVDAAADLSNGLGDVQFKGEKIEASMRLIASQTKIGSIEMADWAKRMPKIAAAAGQVEGDFGTNVGNLAALGQISKRGGGAATAAEAATSVAGLINTLKTPARVAQFQKQGINVFGGGGKIRDPVEIILESLKKTKGDPLALKKLFANVQGERAVTGLANVYRDAGGGAAGEAAFRSAIAEFTKDLLTADEVQKSLNETLKTQKSQAEIFNTEMSKVVEELQSVIVPALVAIAPLLVKVAGGIAGWIKDTFGDKAAEWQAKYGGGVEQASKIAGTLGQGIDKGALPMESYDIATRELAAARARQTELAATTKEYDDRRLWSEKDKDWIGGRKLEGFGTQKEMEDYKAISSLKTKNEEAIEELVGAIKIMADNIADQNGAVVRVHMIEDSTKKPEKPKHSPLGGHQAIAAGC